MFILGVNALFSGSFNEFSAIKGAYDIILPPFVSYLSKHPLPTVSPDDPDTYTGKYTFVQGNNKLSIDVVEKNKILFIVIGGLSTYYLNYKTLNLMQVNLFKPYNCFVC